MNHRRIGYIMALLLLVSGYNSYAEQLNNPYMVPVKINMQQCIQQNTNDCLKSICLASPDSCKGQCAANARDKCKLLAGQTL